MSLLCLLILLSVHANGSVLDVSIYVKDRSTDFSTYLPLGSVCLDQVGVHLMTVSAHCGGKCSSNMVRYQ